MGRAWEGIRHDDDAIAETPSRFPLWVALGSCVVAIVIYYSSTVPALQEQRALRQQERASVERLLLLDEARRLGLKTRDALDRDPQTVLLELDRLGLTPADLLPGPEQTSPPGTPR